MSDMLMNVALEMVVLSAIALVYYYWQRHRILNGPRNWPSNKLVEVHHLAVNCLEPEKYRDLVPFIEYTEKRLEDEKGVIDRDYLDRWQHSELPAEIKTLLSECAEWMNQSQPRTR